MLMGIYMKQQDDYIAGPHHYWIHFWCGLVFGACIGVLIAWRMFDEGWSITVTSAVVALAVAISCGRWGDRAWHWIIRSLS